MTTSRFAPLLLSSALLAVACVPLQRGQTSPAAAAAADMVLVQTAAGLAALDPLRTSPAYVTTTPVAPTADWARLYTVLPGQAAAGALGVLDAATGRRLATRPLLEGLAPRVVSASGQQVALAAPDSTPYRPAARASTRLAVAETAGNAAPRLYDLPGNFEPEAFSTDDRALYVLEYLPPLAPEGYRVRQLDLASGQVRPLVDRFKRVPLATEETMRGTGRTQVLSADRTVLYTLYSQQPEHVHGRDMPPQAAPVAPAAGAVRPDVHAFVHTLNLAQGWAFCVNLPLPFGDGPANALTLAVSPDGGSLFVADRASDVVARVDTASLEVQRVERLASAPAAAEGVAASAAAADGRTLYLAGGAEVLALDPSLAVRARWPLAVAASGLGLSPDGARLYVGQADRVQVLDTRSGADLGTLWAPGPVVAVPHVAARAAPSLALAP